MGQKWFPCTPPRILWDWYQNVRKCLYFYVWGCHHNIKWAKFGFGALLYDHRNGLERCRDGVWGNIIICCVAYTAWIFTNEVSYESRDVWLLVAVSNIQIRSLTTELCMPPFVTTGKALNQRVWNGKSFPCRLKNDCIHKIFWHE